MLHLDSHNFRKLLFLLVFFCCAHAHAANPVHPLVTEISDMQVATRAATALGKKYGPEHVLVIFDIDNTLLAMDEVLGSDQWFNWQADLLAANPKSTELMAKTFPELLTLQGILFERTHMHPPQPNSPELFTHLQKRGFMTLILTSRGEEFREATERELANNGYDTKKTAYPCAVPAKGTYLPYDLKKLAACGLTPEEIEQFALKAPQPVSYCDGIFMTAGQHKGAMLRTLLSQGKRSVSAVVFVDDHKKHSERVQAALADCNIECVTFRYTREDGNVERFNASDKKDVLEAFRKLELERAAASR